MPKKIIGLLGGIGPESTGCFYLKLIERFVKGNNPTKNTEYPHIIINSIPAPELILQVGTEEVLKPYIEGLKLLEKNNVSIIGIICNTAYIYLDILQKEVLVPIVNMRAELENKLKDLRVQSALVLGTSYTIKSNLYNFECFKNINLNLSETKDLDMAISNYNLGIDKENQKKVVHDLIKAYKDQVDIVILGCSEIALMAEGVDVRTINPMDVLIEILLRKTSYAI